MDEEKPLTEQYRSPADLPPSIPVFPLANALLLPRCNLPLNIFERRYLKMVDDAMRGTRIIGMIQPDGPDAISASRDPKLKPPLCSIGCAGRITSYAETPDGRMHIMLSGITRFRLRQELSTTTPYRMCAVEWEEFAHDLVPEYGSEKVSRDKLLEVLKKYLETHGLQANWRTIRLSKNEMLVNSLCVISPYGVREKQALLEAKSLEDRTQILIALTEIALQQTSTDSNTTVQ